MSKRERKNRLRLAVLVPQWGGPNDFWISFLGIRGVGNLLSQDRVVFPKGAYVQDSHNLVVNELLKKDDWDYLGWLENDHRFPPDLLERAAFYREPVVGHLYFSKEEPFPPIVYHWNEGMTAVRHATPDWVQWMREPGMYPVGAVGNGATFIRRDVFERFDREYPDRPWYAVPTQKTGRPVSDDIWFCRHVREMYGERSIWVDTRGGDLDHMVPFAVNHKAATAALMQQAGKEEQPPTLVVPYVSGKLREETKQAVEACGLNPTYVELQGDEAYFELFEQMWQAGGTWINNEQDIVPTRDHIESLVECSEPWCAFAYDYPPFGKYAGSGCVKYSAALIARFPEAIRTISAWSDEKHPPRHWCRLDGWLKQYLTEQGVRQHLHGEVPHLHSGRPAHGCVTSGIILPNGAPAPKTLEVVR